MRKQLLILSLLIVAGCTGNSNLADAETKKEIKKPTPSSTIKRKKKRIMVAVIDTGIDEALMNKDWICPDGHKDFTGMGLKDNHGHGTHISGIIDQYAKDYIFLKNKKVPKDIDGVDADYCQIIIKYYDPKAYGNDNLKNTIKAFRWAIDQKVDIINYSGGGTEYSAAERAVVEEALNKGIKFVAAAGNERSDIDLHKYYPAMYDKRTFIVANLVSTDSREVASSSNHGKSINTYELGTNVLSRLPGGTFGYMTGTSQAAAVKSGKLVREMLLAK